MSIITAYRVRDCDCGHVETRSWAVRPSETALHCPKCGADRALYTVRERFTAHVPRNARKRFMPHESTAFGCYVESPEHLSKLQRKYGCEDVEPKKLKDLVPTNYDSREFNARAEGTLQPDGFEVVSDSVMAEHLGPLTP